MKIGFFDSGHGGVTILAAVKAVLSGAEYYYIADAKHCPYGDKSEAELYAIVKNNVEQLLKWGAEIIVVACNTATVRCIDKLRRDYPDVKFVGTEPAIRLATKSGARKILVLATPGTVESERTQLLVAENLQPDQTIKLLACPGLADVIEARYVENGNGVEGKVDDLDGAIDAKLGELLSGEPDEYDVVVLGCTHYPLVKEKIQRFFPSARLVDGSTGVAERVKDLTIESV
ncbi:glutamate racemase [Candidatus Saccharibacteria bacterium]|nr:glutamate racemase [Candidatus Saccharibacteria bacterium]